MVLPHYAGKAVTHGLEENAGPIMLERADRRRLRLTLAGRLEIELVEN
ncbi:hypothetical protein PY650_09825 [Rhizobium calliandrae]|uniref:Uncharacterized protein n=1 Tax=Rhizobium calliandrae TaxID=1312182 RepID=A0ABT7KBH6_9HYPH|nr:hypothetical protein [Rhizobium calliandrae]MDL2405958.1 hypothetical protein [Rhizobium calliandrae]